MDRRKRHECLAGAAFRNNGSGLGTMPALHDAHHRQTLSCEGASQQGAELIRDRILGSLECRVNLQDPVAQFLRKPTEIGCDRVYLVHTEEFFEELDELLFFGRRCRICKW